MKSNLFVKMGVTFLCFISTIALASTDGSISGTVVDSQGVAVSGAQVQLINASGNVVKETTTSLAGQYRFFPITFGDYQLSVKANGSAPYQAAVHVASDANTSADVSLATTAPKEMVLNVVAKKHLVQSSSSVSSSEINSKDIDMSPQGEDIHLPKLLATTTPGVVQGPFGQSFIRGNHANIQYQIDGVQLPDSPSNTFGDAFTPRNIDHMEVITGGIPAEYGERLAAVVNIVTKTGTETPGGEVELNYGSYNTTTPFVLYSGSNKDGDVHYFFSGGFTRSDRGLDVPEPTSESNIAQGGWNATHDFNWGDNEFAKIDWIVNNSNKLSFIAFNSFNYYQIPNFPGSFGSQDPYFVPCGPNAPNCQLGAYTDQFGNNAVNWTPPGTDDDQSEVNSYFQVVWKNTISDTSFLQVAPYFKYSYVGVTGDPTNDLASAAPGPNQIVGAQPDSFIESRPVNNYGLKADYTNRLSENHLFKAGTQLQFSQSTGGIALTAVSSNGGYVVAGSGNTFQTSTDYSPDTGYFESLYAQDDWTISKQLIVNLGVRFDATQFSFSTLSPTDSLTQPRIGINYMLTDNTKLHFFFGELFQPAPVEDLRDAFVAFQLGQIVPYDIQAEKDTYYEAGIAQQWGDQVFMLNSYYKNALSMLDDTQLLNTSVAAAYNYSNGFAYGTEFTYRGSFGPRWSAYLNCAYEIAMGNGASGGLFAVPTTQIPTNWTYLDHVQIVTANAGLSYKNAHWWGTFQPLYGSGLRTGPDNTTNLPGHLTFDATVGYEFTGESWWDKYKVSADVLNILNDAYPITIANGFNGSHYAAGTEWFVHFNKEL